MKESKNKGGRPIESLIEDQIKLIRFWQEELFKPYRYKVIYGGRCSGKSYGVADALILISYSKKCLILCTREFQLSFRSSAHSLICERIEALGLSKFFKITHNEILNTLSNSRFIFKGLRDINADRTRSIVGITHLWIEDADNISIESWQRIHMLHSRDESISDNSYEIWATMNPKNETDVIYQKFIECLTPPEDAYVAKVNWQDNPYFPKTLKKTIKDDKQIDYIRYRHIWEGECLGDSERLISSV